MIERQLTEEFPDGGALSRRPPRRGRLGQRRGPGHPRHGLAQAERRPAAAEWQPHRQIAIGGENARAGDRRIVGEQAAVEVGNRDEHVIAAARAKARPPRRGMEDAAHPRRTAIDRIQRRRVDAGAAAVLQGQRQNRMNLDAILAAGVGNNAIFDAAMVETDRLGLHLEQVEGRAREQFEIIGANDALQLR